MVLFWKAYLHLLGFERYIAQHDFAGLYEKVRQYACRARDATADDIARACSAVDKACAFYWKPVLCLQRSAAAACLLRSQGVRAELVIGTQPLPLRCHAWVEVDGQVVNDKAYMRCVYAVLARC